MVESCKFLSLLYVLIFFLICLNLVVYYIISWISSGAHTTAHPWCDSHSISISVCKCEE